MKTKTIIYNVKGKKYELVYDRLCNQTCLDGRSFYWFVYQWFGEQNITWDFIGYFKTKKEAENCIGFE